LSEEGVANWLELEGRVFQSMFSVISGGMQANLRFEGSENDSPLNALEGLKYHPEFIDPSNEAELLARVQTLPFREFEFHGYLGMRRIVSFGWRYEYSGRGELKRAEEVPDFLLDLRRRAATFAQLEPELLQQVLVTEYRGGSGIGWHRDKPVFDQIVGISLLAPCVLRFRRKVMGNLKAAGSRGKWERVNVLAEPRSAYLLEGPVRSEWEHSILRVEELRYSVTFRSLRQT
jgi:alkylated DNA repair dioxygenase AlkB